MATKSAIFRKSAGQGPTSAFTGLPSLTEAVDINDLATSVTLDVLDSARLSLQVVLATGIFGTAVFTLKRTLDGKTLLTFSPAKTITAEGITDGFDVSDLKEVIMEVTTVSGGPATVDITAIRSDIPLTA